MNYREAGQDDVAAMAALRAREWGNQAGWEERIARYLAREHHPQQALLPRIAYVAEAGGAVVGFAAGHLTRRHGCQGELQWLNVAPACRRQGMGTALLRLMARWFEAQRAVRVCVDCDPVNAGARAFYGREHAAELNPHWLVWDDITVVLRPR